VEKKEEKAYTLFVEYFRFFPHLFARFLLLRFLLRGENFTNFLQGDSSFFCLLLL